MFSGLRVQIGSEPFLPFPEMNLDASGARVVIPHKPAATPGGIVVTAGSREGETELCRHYCRTGTCGYSKECPYVHDRSKVQLCMSYLGGLQRHSGLGSSATNLDVAQLCKRGPNCQLVHEVDRERAPECGPFTRNGYCPAGTKCVYQHVKKAPGAQPCARFLQWYCARGSKCAFRHSEEFRERPKKFAEKPLPEGKRLPQGIKRSVPAAGVSTGVGALESSSSLNKGGVTESAGSASQASGTSAHPSEPETAPTSSVDPAAGAGSHVASSAESPSAQKRRRVDEWNSESTLDVYT